MSAVCEICETGQGDIPTEHVEGRGPGWKCPCGWWNVLSPTQQPTQAPLVAEAFIASILEIRDDIDHGIRHNGNDHREPLSNCPRCAVDALIRQLEQADTRIAVLEMGDMTATAHQWELAFKREKELREQAEREKERNTAIAKWALEQCRMWWKGARRDLSNVDAALAELDRMDGILSEQNTKPSGEVGEEHEHECFCDECVSPPKEGS